VGHGRPVVENKKPPVWGWRFLGNPALALSALASPDRRGRGKPEEEEIGGEAVHGGILADADVAAQEKWGRFFGTVPKNRPACIIRFPDIEGFIRMRLAAFALAVLASAAFAAPTGDGGKARAFSHDIKPGGVVEECLRLEAGRSRAFEWSADGPLDFNIHFHRGDDVNYPVKLNGQPKGNGRFTASSGEDYCWMWTARRPTRLTGTLGPEE
jgi:hypothetical protein